MMSNDDGDENNEFVSQILIQNLHLIDQQLSYFNQLQQKLITMKNNLNNEREKISQQIFNLCPHQWIDGCERGIDEHREKICQRCGTII